MEELIVVIILAMLSLEDLLKKKISIYLSLLFILLGVFMGIYREGNIGPWIIFSLLPGGIVIAMSIVSRGRIGIGDGLCLMITSLMLGYGCAVFAFFLSLLMIGVIGEVLVLSHRIKRGASLPLVPFMLLGTVVSFVI